MVELLVGAAPISSGFLRGLLPIESDSFNSKWNGAELFGVLPPMEPPVTENPLGSVQPGDVVLFHWDATHRGVPKRLRAAGIGAYTELGFYYGGLIRAYGPAGPATGMLVGRVVEGLDALARVALIMRREGFDRLRIAPRS